MKSQELEEEQLRKRELRTLEREIVQTIEIFNLCCFFSLFNLICFFNKKNLYLIRKCIRGGKLLYTDKMVNDILNYSKDFINQIIQNKSGSEELKGVLYLVFAGLMSYYGTEYLNEIRTVFINSDFIYSRQSVYDVYEKFKYEQGIDRERVERLQKEDVKAFVKNSFLVYSPTQVKIKTDVYLFENKNISFDEFLEEAIHEINHQVNSVKGNIVRKNGLLFSRSGLSYSSLTGDNIINEAKILEESINVLQTSEIMQHILAFCDYNIDDPEIRYLVDKLKSVKREGREDKGYNIVVPIIKPLYQVPEFNLILKKRRVSGEIKIIREEFDSKTTEGAFLQLADIFDKIDNDISVASFDEIGMDMINSHVLVKQYIINNLKNV